MKELRYTTGMLLAMLTAGWLVPAQAQIDTTGITGWTPMYNSMASWEEGAFGANAGEHPDYGWGVYNTLTHSLAGDSIFVIRLQDQQYRILWIKSRSASAVYTIRHAGLDGSLEQEVEIDMSLYADKQFAYYNLRGDSLVDEQPPAADWDLMLTKYSQTELGGYPVTGFLSNDGVTVSVFHAADSATAADATLADTTEFTDSISAIGDSWSTLKGFSIVPLDTIVYFIRTDSGVVYQMQATFFESGMSGLGRVGIRKKNVDSTSWVHDTLVMGASYADEVYYSMEQGTVGTVARNLWDIGFKSGVFTSSITANTTMGVELYTYPYADTSIWSQVTAAETVSANGNGIRLYPVPATSHLYISHGLKTHGPLNISVFEMTGKKVLDRWTEGQESGVESLDITTLSPGVYILKLNNGKEQLTQRFIKRR